jgi:hypothetical protein
MKFPRGKLESRIARAWETRIDCSTDQAEDEAEDKVSVRAAKYLRTPVSPQRTRAALRAELLNEPRVLA